MFDNVGEKIKALAKAIVWVGTAIFCIIGFSCWNYA